MDKYKENSPIKNFFSGLTEKILSVNSDMDEEYDDEESEVDNYREEEPAPRYHEPASRAERIERPSAAKRPVNNIISFNRENMPQKSVEITDPSNLEEATRVADFLLQGIIVTVNLESIDKKDAQRVADFICGASYTLNAVISRISNHIFIITPSGTGVSGGRKEGDDVYELPKAASYR